VSEPPSVASVAFGCVGVMCLRADPTSSPKGSRRDCFALALVVVLAALVLGLGVATYQQRLQVQRLSTPREMATTELIGSSSQSNPRDVSGP